MTMKKNMTDGDIFDLDFLSKDILPSASDKSFYKVVIADDDEDIHALTTMLLRDFEFEGKRLSLLHTYTAKETIKIIIENPDTAVLILDVVMEAMDAGLKVINHIRDVMKNKAIRIILRTGQPGYAPEDSLIKEYDINDYKLKTELTKQKLYTSLYSCFRSYRDFMEIDRNKRALEELVKITGDLFKRKSLIEFLNSIFKQIQIFNRYKGEEITPSHNGVVFKHINGEPHIIVGTGIYSDIHGPKSTELISEIRALPLHSRHMHKLEHGIIFSSRGLDHIRDYVYIEINTEDYDDSLITLLLNNYALALENYELNHLLLRSHEDVIYTLTETIERHSNETSNHVKRVANLMQLLASETGYPDMELSVLKMASILHDIGKIGIPDSILTKPGKLTADEFEEIKKHTLIGYDILRNNDHPVFKKASEIAYYHHEKFDGTGYPNGLSGEAIPVEARMMSIIDVFDALQSKRCYKEAFPMEAVLTMMQEQSGSHFDPKLLEAFMKNMDKVLNILDQHQD